MEKPHKDDPWVRVIDAAPPEEALASGTGSHKMRFRRHPRHDRARVSADGSVVDDNDASTDDASAREHGAILEEKLTGGAVPQASHSSRNSHSAGAGVGVRAAAEPAQIEPLVTMPTLVAASNGSAPEAGTHGGGISASSSSSSSGGRRVGGGGNTTGGAVAGEEDELRDYFRSVDRAATAAAGNRTRTAATGGTPTSRLWKVIPGGVHDIIEGDGANQTTFTTEGLKPPTVSNGSYVVDMAGALPKEALFLLNRNMTWVDRLTPFRVLLLVLPRQPRDPAARTQYARQILRAWYRGTRMGLRTALVIISLDGAVEIAVGEQTKIVLSEGVARHFAHKAMELFQSHTDDTPDAAKRLSDTAQKLIFYVSFTVRSRTQMTAMSMRSVSMFMMMFMMMTIAATKQQQARRYAELYGYNYRYAGLYGGDMYGSPLYGYPRSSYRHRGDFWGDDYEAGGRGGYITGEREQANAFLRLQILSMLLADRGHGQFEEEDDDEYEEDEGEEDEHDLQVLSAQAAAYYEEERRHDHR